MYKSSFNHLLIKLLEQQNLLNSNATDNRVLELYSCACSSDEHNAAISYIIIHLTYIQGSIHGIGRGVIPQLQICDMSQNGNKLFYIKH